jgi:hypothetical protein
MARSRSSDRKNNPARTPEARELQLASAAYDLAEEQLNAGTASSQVITHFLKMGSTRERLEQQSIQHDIELKKVKAEQIEAQKHIESLFVEAISAMRSYQGGEPVESPDE